MHGAFADGDDAAELVRVGAGHGHCFPSGSFSQIDYGIGVGVLSRGDAAQGSEEIQRVDVVGERGCTVSDGLSVEQRPKCFPSPVTQGGYQA